MVRTEISLEESMILLEGMLASTETVRKIVDCHLTGKSHGVSWHLIVFRDNVKDLVKFLELDLQDLGGTQ